MNFGIGSAFSKGLGSAFSEGPDPGTGPPYKVFPLSEQISGQNSGKISTSGNFLPRKLCLYDAFAHQLEHC